MQKYQEWVKRNERRFRASIYVDIFVPDSGNKEQDRERAADRAKKAADFLSAKLGNAYVGGVATDDEIMGGKEI